MRQEISQKSSRVLPETINIHLTRNCNFHCHFCYAEFAECDSSRIRLDRLRLLLNAISCAPPPPSGRKRKMNFAGGEPFLYAGLPEIIKFSKQLGLTTSVVTNGSLLGPELLDDLSGALDMCALSVDSGVVETNGALGRCGKGFWPDAHFYRTLACQIHGAGIRLKTNTVVNRLNLPEDLGTVVADLEPFRWKLFQVKEVIGQNDDRFGKLAISVAEFNQFVERNRGLVPPAVVLVPETADDMTASYAMIAPNGCFFDNSEGRYRYSRPILEVGINEAFGEVQFDAHKFTQRGGLYE
jgi:radical S-adenosyl methionine domain-containing protein 2